MAAGARVKAVQRMLGHGSASMTLDVHAGLFGDDRDADLARSAGDVESPGKRRSPGQ
ncbi:hypothetical protein OHS32_03085 [Micromonospora chokoriensis]